MKVLHVAEAFGGGVQETVTNLSVGMADAGHDVTIAYGIRPETPQDIEARFDPRVRLVKTGWDDRGLRSQLVATRALRALCREVRPDVIHLHSSFAGFVGALALRGRAPMIFTPHAWPSTMADSGTAGRNAYRLAERTIVRSVTEVIASSTEEGEVAEAIAGDGRAVRVIENGIPQLDRPVTRPAGSRTVTKVLAMGRTVPQRRPEACARILGSLRDVAEVQWLGGGGGERGIEGARALEAAGIPPSGWLSPEDFWAALGEATAYLHWTAWDGHPLSILHAMALDVVVVASDIGPNREILGPDQVCRTEDEAAALLRRVIAEPDVARELLDAQRERRRRYGAGRMVRDWVGVYEELIAGGVRAGSAGTAVATTSSSSARRAHAARAPR